jgi:preprotein translocase subunit SecD
MALRAESAGPTISRRLLFVTLAVTSCGGAPDLPSVTPESQTSPPGALSLPQRAGLQLRRVINILPASSGTEVTCELEDPALADCLVSTLNQSRVVFTSMEAQVPGKYELGPLIVDAGDVAQAAATRAQTEWTVTVDLTAGSAAIFEKATDAAAGAPPPRDQIAIIVDGAVVSSPTVVAPIGNGSLEISGGFSQAEATSLATSLGSLN